MIRTFPFQGAGSSTEEGERRSWASLLWLVGALFSVALLAAIAAHLVVARAAPGLALSMPDGAVDVPLEPEILVKPGGWLTSVDSVTLREQRGASPAGTDVATSVEVTRQGWQPDETELRVRPRAALRPDTTYAFIVEGTALEATLPLPSMTRLERRITFKTPSSPRPQPVAEPARLAWGAPLPINWNMPIKEFSYTVTPSAAIRGWVDPGNPHVSYVVVQQPREGTTYQITITGAVGENGMSLQSAETYRLTTPVRPRLIDAAQPTTVQVAQPVALHWNVPMSRVTFEVTPAVSAVWQIDPRDKAASQLRLADLQQGQSYTVTVKEAVAESGAPLAEGQSFKLNVPPALAVAEIAPEADSLVAVSARPTITFDQPIGDRRAAEAAIVLEPAITGRFEWLSDQEVRFVPARSLPYETQIHLSIRGGPGGPRAAAGGFLEDAPAVAFQTVPNKTIDVSISKQVLTLYEGNRPVRSFLVGTGVPGADTPLGEFRVQYKMPTARFQGVNTASGTAYDLPNVKWVLAFMGDYTIHGAYWRQQFGRPGSNGCVSLTDDDAKIVYDWAPEGTLIRIHQ